MTEKTFTIKPENSPNTYTVVLSSSSVNLGIKVKNNSNPEEYYECPNISLAELQKKNKTYKQFDSISKIVDILGKKIESKNFVFKTNLSVLSIKNTNEYDEIEYIPFEIPSKSKPAAPSSSSAELVRLREENERLRKENLNLQSQLKGVPKPTYTAPAAAPKPAPAAPKPAPVTSVTNRKDAMPVSKAPQNAHEKFWNPIQYDNSAYVKDQHDTSSAKENAYQMVCPFGLGNRASYINNQPILQRLDVLVNKKKNLKNTVDDLQKRFDGLRAEYERVGKKLFSGNPSQDDKMNSLEAIKKILILYQETRDIEHYDDIIKSEVAAKGMTFTGGDKTKYDEGIIVLGKSIQFQVAQQLQKLNHALRDLLKNFFSEKHMRFYKPAEIQAANDFQAKLLWNTN